MDNAEEEKKLEKALKQFWADYGSTISVNAIHTYVNVQPKFVVGNRINEEVAKKIVGVYLSQISSDKIVTDQVQICNDGVKIYDKGKLVLEIVNQKMVDSITNKTTCDIGNALAKKEKKGGGAYLVAEKQKYSFGEIKQALSEFLMDASKHDSKNMLKDAVMLLVQ